jgi:hypothetical protein
VKRNWEKKAEKGGAAKALADAWLERHAQVFELWHRFREKKCTRSELRERMFPLRFELQQVLARGKRSRNRTLARFCGRLMDQFQHLWTFAEVDGVEQPCGAGAASGGVVASSVVRLPQRGGLPLRGTHPDRGANPTRAEAVGADVPRRHDRRSPGGGCRTATTVGVNGYEKPLPSNSTDGVKIIRSAP